jgi:translation initiation factor IF-1
MERDDLVETEGEIIECLPNSLWNVKLGNGHRVLAHLGPKMTPESNQFLPGALVKVQLRVFDLSVGQIVSLVRSAVSIAGTT